MTINNINNINAINTISPETEAELEALFAERKPIEPEEPFYHDALVIHDDDILRVIYAEEDMASYAEELGCSEDELSIFFPSAEPLSKLNFNTNVLFTGGDIPVITKTDHADQDAALISLKDFICWLYSPITRVALSREAYLSCIACIIDIIAPNFSYLYRSVYWDENLEDGFAAYITSGCYEFDDFYIGLEHAARSYIGLFLEAISYGLDPNDECSAFVLSITNMGSLIFEGLEDWQGAEHSDVENIFRSLVEAA